MKLRHVIGLRGRGLKHLHVESQDHGTRDFQRLVHRYHRNNVPPCLCTNRNVRVDYVSFSYGAVSLDVPTNVTIRSCCVIPLRFSPVRSRSFPLLGHKSMQFSSSSLSQNDPYDMALRVRSLSRLRPVVARLRFAVLRARTFSSLTCAKRET